MNRWGQSVRFPSVLKMSVITLVVLAAIALGPLVQILHVGVREIAIFVVGLLIAVLVLVPSERILKFGFTFWILTFAFGWRTIYLTPNFNIHPSEVVIVILFFALFARSIIKRVDLDFSLPVLIPVFLLFGVIGIATAALVDRPMDVVLEEFKPFLAIVLSYYVVKWMVHSREDWERAARWSIVVAVYIGILGLMDYFLPGLSRSLSGLQDIETVYLAGSYQGSTFSRVGFIFFGNFAAGFVIFPFLGFTVYHLLERFHPGQEKTKTILFAVFLIIQIAGIYLSGFRGLWYATAVFFCIYVFLRRQAILLFFAGFLVLPMLPSDFINRFQSVFNPEFADSSQYDRIFRANRALDMLQQSPLTGVGWGGSGYVHSDFIQIAANLGLVAIFMFLMWIGGILYELFQVTRSSGWASGYASVLFPTVCALIIIFAGEGLALFVQLIMPIWFLFAMCYKLAALNASQEPSSTSSLLT